MRHFFPLLLLLAINLSAADLSRGPYLQTATDHSIVIVWRVVGEGTPVVRYGRAADKLDHTVPAAAIVTRSKNMQGALELDDAPGGTVQYEAQISELEPDSLYYYAVADGDRQLAGGAAFSFRTNPVPGTARAFRALVLGDGGTGGKDQKAVFAAFQQWQAGLDRPVELFIHVGDMAYNRGRDPEFQENFFAIYGPLLQNTICWPAMGNHEGYSASSPKQKGPYYDAFVLPTRAEAGGVPSGTEAYYAFDYGRVHFIVLNSHDIDRAADGAMARWLKADLERTTADFLIAYWHHPAYTKGTHDSDKEPRETDMRQVFMPMLEAGGIDLILAGHSHIYERSMLVDGAYDTPTTAEGHVIDAGDGDPAGDGPYAKQKGLHPHQGTVAVTAGHAGQNLGRKAVHVLMKRSILEYGAFLFAIDGQTLTGQMLDHTGKIQDTFVIDKRADAPVRHGKAVALPGPPLALVAQGAKWQYQAGGDPASTEWQKTTINWPEGPAGFGYGDNDDATDLKALMENREVLLRIRHSFTVADPAALTNVVLNVRFDDGFAAWLNGTEIARANHPGPDGKVGLHEAKTAESFPVPANLLRAGANILAIEGVNAAAASSDFTLDPVLIAQPR